MREDGVRTMDAITLSGLPADLSNWSRTERSHCSVVKAHDGADILGALAGARSRGVSLIPHGAGHSYTDAALNTGGVVLDLTPMRQILSWDPQLGIMRVEPGVTLRDVVRVALPDGWWPPVTPSTAEATIGGCVAMNVTGKNAWKSGSFGEHVQSLTVLLATGDALAVSPTSDPQLWRALMGSAGLLGIITSMTLQLQRLTSGRVDVAVRRAATFAEILTIFEQEQSADYLEALVDGFAGGRHVGRGIVTCTTYSDECDGASLRFRAPLRLSGRVTGGLARCAGMIGRPAAPSAVRVANRALYWWSAWGRRGERGRVLRHRSLSHSTYYPPEVLMACQTLLPRGIETLQACVPRAHAAALFKEILWRSQANGFTPLWCVVKQHRPDPFLLSYQLEGFSLEVNYQAPPQTAPRLRAMLRELMALAVDAGARFYLAKDSLLTNSLYRRSMGDATVEAFLRLKRLHDPDMLLQSDLFRRVLQPPLE